MPRQVLRYFAVGLLGYLLALAVFASSVDLTGPTVAALLAFVSALANNFAWNRRWTFEVTHGSVARQALRFALLHVVIFLLVLALLHILIGLGLRPLAAQALAMLALAVPSFLAHRSWSFGEGIAGASAAGRSDAAR